MKMICARILGFFPVGTMAFQDPAQACVGVMTMCQGRDRPVCLSVGRATSQGTLFLTAPGHWSGLDLLWELSGVPQHHPHFSSQTSWLWPHHCGPRNSYVSEAWPAPLVVRQWCPLSKSSFQYSDCLTLCPSSLPGHPPLEGSLVSEGSCPQKGISSFLRHDQDKSGGGLVVLEQFWKFRILFCLLLEMMPHSFSYQFGGQSLQRA